MPPHTTNRFELGYTQSAALVSTLAAWHCQCGNYCFTRRFVNGCGIEVPVKKNKENCIEIFFDVNGTYALSSLTTFKHTAAFDLNPENFAIASFGGVVACLSRGGKCNPKNTSSFVLGYLSGYAQWLPREDAISPSKLLRFSEDFEYRISRHGEAQRCAQRRALARVRCSCWLGPRSIRYTAAIITEWRTPCP